MNREPTQILVLRPSPTKVATVVYANRATGTTVKSLEKKSISDVGFHEPA